MLKCTHICSCYSCRRGQQPAPDRNDCRPCEEPMYSDYGDRCKVCDITLDADGVPKNTVMRDGKTGWPIGCIAPFKCDGGHFCPTDVWFVPLPIPSRHVLTYSISHFVLQSKT